MTNKWQFKDETFSLEIEDHHFHCVIIQVAMQETLKLAREIKHRLLTL
jgi:hypothetical protein